MKTEDSLQHEAVALSVTSARSVSDLFRMIEDNSPGEIIRLIGEKKKPEVQDYLNELYGHNPMAAAEKIIENCSDQKIRILHYWSEEYPELLKKIYNPPVVLYCRGTISINRSIALVGSRKTDSVSRNICSRIAHDLSEAGYTIVSGMAVGIDRSAHVSALDAGGSTIAVLANGIDRLYPRENADLYERITGSAESALVSEYPPGAIAGRWTFVRRNRIISGLSVGTVVVKAAEKSGALITASYAIEQNRDLFVCPGNSFDREYEGCINLLKNGAVPVFDTKDIFEVIGCSQAVREDNEIKELMQDKDDSIEKNILSLLESGMCDIDTLIRRAEASPGDVNYAVMGLELRGIIQRNGNNIELKRFF